MSLHSSLRLFRSSQFRPVCASTQTPEDADAVRAMLKDAGIKCDIFHGIDGVDEVAKCAEADTVVTGIVGAVGLQPTMSAIRLGKDIALANKETLISGGPVINPLVKEVRLFHPQQHTYTNSNVVTSLLASLPCQPSSE